MQKRIWFFSALTLCLCHALIVGRGSFVLAQSKYTETSVQGGGSIRGIVKLVGAIPKLEQLAIAKDDKVCGRKKSSPRLVVGRNMGVANAIVYVEGITQGKKFSDTPKSTLNQHKCEYEPHILLVSPRTQLEIVNSHKVLHNVHSYDVEADMKTIFNIAQPIVGQRTTVRQRPRNNTGLAVATCDAGHPWMSAYIMYIDHPYYALTDSQGNFILEDIPPGSYNLKMWHEGVAITRTEMERETVKKYYYEEPYESVREVAVLSGQTATVSFELSLR